MKQRKNRQNGDMKNIFLITIFRTDQSRYWLGALKREKEQWNKAVWEIRLFREEDFEVFISENNQRLCLKRDYIKFE